VQRLTEDQRARVEKLARDEGTTCEGCGCARLRCGEEARRTHDHGLMVYLCCAPTRSTLGEPTNTSRSPLGRTSVLEASFMRPSTYSGVQ
jgi:hypothetical protein